LQRPAEHPPVVFPEDEAPGSVPDPEATEALWDEMFKHNRRQQERLQRALEERLGRGEDEDAAFENALDDLGLEVPSDDSEPLDELWCEEPEPFAGEAAPDNVDSGDGDEKETPFESEEDRHPLLRRALDLLKQLHGVFRGADPRYEPSLRTLFQGAGDAMGGLAQALCGREEADDPDDYGLRVVQLKRALRGAAFARGALFPLCSAVTAEQFDELYRTLGQLEQDIFHELSRLRSEHRAGDS
jgi:hypothetical protein